MKAKYRSSKTQFDTSLPNGLTDNLIRDITVTWNFNKTLYVGLDLCVYAWQYGFMAQLVVNICKPLFLHVFAFLKVTNKVTSYFFPVTSEVTTYNVSQSN